MAHSLAATAVAVPVCVRMSLGIDQADGRVVEKGRERRAGSQKGGVPGPQCVCVCVWLPSLFSFCPNNSSKCNNTRYLNTHIFVCWICPDDAHASCCWHNTHIRAHAEGKLIESCKSQRRRGKIGVTYIPSFSRRHCCCRWSRAKKVTNENSVMSCSLSLFFWHWQDGVAVQCCARMHLDLGMFSRCLAESSAMMDQDLTHLIGLFFRLLKKKFRLRMKLKKNDDGEEHSLTFRSREREKRSRREEGSASAFYVRRSGVGVVVLILFAHFCLHFCC